MPPDLQRLLNEGYDAYIHDNIMVLKGVPYVNEKKEITHGTLVSPLTMSGNTLTYQRNTGGHVMYFQGDLPCDENGRRLSMFHSSNALNHAKNHITTNYSFSRKPPNDYVDYYSKFKGYITGLMAPAFVIDNNVQALKTGGKEHALQDEDVFHYADTNSGRSDFSSISDKLRDYKIGIIGLGGTGSYILDGVAKTPVRSISLFDSDVLLNHNAFRAPGATPLSELDKKPNKAEYFKGVYSNMHKHINAFPVDIDASNIELLKELNFVFVSVDKGGVKKLIFEYLQANGIPFVDVGMGFQVTPNNTILGQIRTTAITNDTRKKYLSEVSQKDTDDEVYESNIQISELNSLNASIAIIMWKKHAGFYSESVPVGFSSFVIDTLQHNGRDDEA